MPPPTKRFEVTWEKVVTMLELRVNGKDYTVDVAPETPLLWVMRKKLGLTGIKYGCGMAVCGTCTVYLDGEPIRPCITPVVCAVGKEVTTVEKLVAESPAAAHQVWAAEDAPQYGYC